MSIRLTKFSPEILALVDYFTEEYSHSNDHDELEARVELARASTIDISLSEKEKTLLDYLSMKSRYYTRAEFPCVNRLDEMCAIGFIPAIDYRMKIYHMEPGDEHLRNLLNEEVKKIASSKNTDIKMYIHSAVVRIQRTAKFLNLTKKYVRAINNLCIQSGYQNHAIQTKHPTGDIEFNAFSRVECLRLKKAADEIIRSINSDNLISKRFVIGKRLFASIVCTETTTTFMFLKSNQIAYVFDIKYKYDSKGMKNQRLEDSKSNLVNMACAIAEHLEKPKLNLKPLFTDELN